jgi:hypothetical protein
MNVKQLIVNRYILLLKWAIVLIMATFVLFSIADDVDIFSYRDYYSPTALLSLDDNNDKLGEHNNSGFWPDRNISILLNSIVDLPKQNSIRALILIIHLETPLTLPCTHSFLC